ncbi:LOW QUALITY PROTEIN: nephrocystin-4-like [Mantella aurantiaca]
MTCCPGYQLMYMVDPGCLKLGEQCWFLRYLALQILQIEVWDGDSLLLIGLLTGPAAVEMKLLLAAANSSRNTEQCNYVTAQLGWENTRKNISQAQKLADLDSELAAMLYSRMKEASLAYQQPNSESDASHRRKMERMMAVRQLESRENLINGKSFLLSPHEERTQHTRDFQTIEAYRERTKAECISSMLNQAITSNYTVYATLGTAEFFEFQLKNPYNVQYTVSIEIDHTDLSLNPGTSISHKDSGALSQYKPNTMTSKIIKVSFKTSDGKLFAILRVNVEPQPHVVNQTFRFYHPELTFLKKSIRLPPWYSLPGAPVGTPGGEPELFARCSDPNIISDTKKLAFEMTIPPGDKGCNKRITYTNPYQVKKRYSLHTNRADLLQFKEATFEPWDLLIGGYIPSSCHDCDEVIS